MKLKAYFSLLLFFLSVSVLADEAPVNMLKQVSQQMITQLDKNQGHISKQTISYIIHQVLLAHIDLESMSRSVVGREHWLQATPAQKEEFKRSFTNLVIKVYSTPLASYDGDRIEFKPLRDAQAVRPQVESIIIRKNGQRIPVTYRLVRSSGAWKIYDFSVEGISMISSYRSQFDTILQQKGMSGLLSRLRG
jgi:phospholipid transport system substrate-binding protein